MLPRFAQSAACAPWGGYKGGHPEKPLVGHLGGGVWVHYILEYASMPRKPPFVIGAWGGAQADIFHLPFIGVRGHKGK